MLISLSISNFVLIDKTEIQFKPGLNIMTGETGSGKSAVIDALNLVLGRRADTDLIRKGQEKASVEALFDIKDSFISSFLEESGISVDPDFLHIKRDISKDGKGRIWINREPATLNVLKGLSPKLMEFVGQRASTDLTDSENHLDILDRMGGLLALRDEYADMHALELKKIRELKNFISKRDENAKYLAKNLAELNEIDAINPQIGEEEALFEEYSLLSNSQELKEGLVYLSNALGGDGLLQALSAFKKKTEEMARIDRSLNESLEMSKEAILNLKEVERFIETKLSNLDANEERLIYLEDRLKTLNRLRKLHGPSMEDVFSKWMRLKQECGLDEGEDTLEKMQKEIDSIHNKAAELASALSKERKASGKNLGEKVTLILKTLNMPNALFSVSILEKPRSETGQDNVEFFLSPNLGENPVSVSQAASGGELSRVLLALKLIEEDALSSIVFDEIDANIGGSTAVLVGEKLKRLSLKKQVILITHFPQVARLACHHIKISKKESSGRTYTEVESLESADREKELLRMAGLGGVLEF